MASIQATPEKGMFISFKDLHGNDQVVAFEKMMSALEKSQPIHHSSKSSDIYRNIYQGNVSIRDEFGRADYEAYRPDERLPQGYKPKIKSAMQVYYDVGIIRNVIDLMGDFTVQGIDLAHPNRKVQRWHKKWWKLVNGKERSERLANYLVRTCNVVAKRETGIINLQQTRSFYKASAGPEDKIESPDTNVNLARREIPYRYIFLNPLSLEIIGDELNTFINPNKVKFGVKLPSSLVQKISSPSTNEERQLISLLPKDLVNSVRKGNNLVPLDPNTIKVSYYKKDDWELWACPIIYSILPNIITLQKMQLADRTALDGAISQVRLWKLGSLENKMYPTAAAVEKLANVLVNSVGGGIVDLIWTPDIELEETTTTLQNFLGETKYVPVLNAIYAGLGIPPLFTGATNQGSFTNNFLAIKTLIERLQYIRERVIEFWETELSLIQKAMDFNEPARLVFDRMTLNDEASILQLITGLVDRNIISEEYAQEMVGAIPEIEDFRVARERKEREKGKKALKAGPFHNPMVEEDYTKMFIQNKSVTPTQVGLELEEPASGEKTPMDMEAEHQLKIAKFKPVGVSGQGRPKNSKDKKKRKQKEVKPRRSVNYLQATIWADETQDFISNYFTPIYLKSLSKKNLRQLSDEEFDNFEKFKFSILANLKLNSKVDNDILNSLVSNKLEIPDLMTQLLNKCIAVYKEKTDKEITTDSRRRLQSGIYVAYNLEENNEETGNNDYCQSPVLGT